jgi:N-acetylglucosaminyl-diphospho-decaprenol L-rhamnosyltransferase
MHVDSLDLRADVALEPSRPLRSPAAAPGAGIALVTVLHDSRTEVAALCASVARHLPGAHLVAVDSGSSDGGVNAVRESAVHATVVELGENAGFGRGTNRGVALVEEPVTVVLNPDVELLDASLAELATEALRHDRPERILAPEVLRPGGERQDSAHPEPAMLHTLAMAIAPPRAVPEPLRSAIQPWRAARPRRVGWAVGCCMVARTGTLRALGPFDGRAFMYAEDLDLCLRAADAGVETWFWPLGRVLHKQGHATRRAFGGEPFELLARRRREVMRERRGRWRQRVDDWQQLATFANRLALKALLGRPATRERRQLRALLAARRRST